MRPWRTSVQTLLLALLCACSAVGPDAHPAVTPFPTLPGAAVGARHAMNTMVLTRDGPAPGQGLYYFSGLEAARISVMFLNHARSRMTLRADCDGRARVRENAQTVTQPAWVAAGQGVQFVLGPRERRRTLLDLHPEVTRCDLTVTPGGGQSYVIRMRREELAHPQVARLDARHTQCPGGPQSDPLMQAFLAQPGALSMTCGVPMGGVRLLHDGVDALAARVEALTGSTVSHAALEAGDPMMPLDWSNAPQLDLIYVNYLNMNADFAGYLMMRMLAWHAARGTAVRILVSDVMLTHTDRALFEGVAAQYPTVQIQPYLMPASAAVGVEGQLGRLHRISHVKLFATIARQPGRSRVMIGGRNIHEGYFFESPRDLSAYPFLHQYDPEQARVTGGFTTYDDFEVELTSDQAARTVAGHMAALWHRDHDTQAPRPPGRTVPARAADGLMRHFISVPFVDGEAQITYYEGLIDAARDHINIAIPYLNLPARLDAALLRARDRGVRVDVVATVRVREAADFMVSNLNRWFGNRFGAWVGYVDYDPFPRLLHSKLIVIDDRLVVIASTNLNMRSFVHDLENGLVFMDRGLARRISRVIDQTAATGQPFVPSEDLPRLFTWLRSIPIVRRMF